MKKFFLLLPLIFFLFATNYATNPDIIITPEKCLVNSSVYVIFQWRAPYAVEDFNVTVFSDAVEFENSTLHYAGVAEDAKVFHIFEGKAVKPGNHTIKVQMKYFVDGIDVNKEFLFNIIILTLPEVTYPNNIKNETENISEIKLENTTTSENITKTFKNITTNITTVNTTNISINETNITLNETNKTENIKNTSTTTSQEKVTQKSNGTSTTQTVGNTQNTSNWLTYGILGLIIGIVFGFIVMYIIKI
ncbi:conserved hypothetical protein [Methanocaldococcus sp. FS406-22]|uniref:hypothetical protein n=1 Tax=Methanocaldococcus sp. (strain FS406-22) TaxID=644281 RepID=UPI0001BF1DF3|nr:hypothetical protein [Methanocaldococcus sp. FS406-22]ADC69011.1 conserved hypothetical protein [Methanocaldococcus sp. FS406-22]